MDLDRIVRREYPSELHRAIHEMIGSVEVREKARVVLACLKNAKGDLEKLKAQLADAPGYWREIIASNVCPRRRKSR